MDGDVLHFQHGLRKTVYHMGLSDDSMGHCVSWPDDKVFSSLYFRRMFTQLPNSKLSGKNWTKRENGRSLADYTRFSRAWHFDSGTKALLSTTSIKMDNRLSHNCNKACAAPLAVKRKGREAIRGRHLCWDSTPVTKSRKSWRLQKSPWLSSVTSRALCQWQDDAVVCFADLLPWVHLSNLHI